MIRPTTTARWLQACLIGGTLSALPGKVGAQTTAAPIVRLYPNYSIEDAAGNQSGPSQAPAVVTLCPSLGGIDPVAQVCPGTSAGNPLYVSGGYSSVIDTIIGVRTLQTTGTTSAAGGIYTVALPEAGATVRRGCTIQNTSAATEYVFFGPDQPTGLAVGLAIAAGTPLDCAHGGVVVAQDTIWIASVSASASYVLLAQ